MYIILLYIRDLPYGRVVASPALGGGGGPNMAIHAETRSVRGRRSETATAAAITIK